MIDTLKLGFDDFKIKTDNRLILQPSPLRVDTKEKLSNFRLWVNEETGEIVEGSKAYYNDDKINVSLLHHQDSTRCMVQLSIPKYHHKDNYWNISRESTIEVFKDLEKKLDIVGIKTNISEAQISRIDTFKNIVTEEGFKTYCPILSMLSAQRTSMRDYGTTFLWYNGEKEFCCYDKITELALTGYDISEYPRNTMRFEYRLKKPRKIEKVLGFNTVESLIKDYGHLQEVYLSSMKGSIFKYNPQEIEVICGSEIEKELRVFREIYPDRRFISNYLIIKGLQSLMNMAGYDTIESSFCNFANNRMDKSRVRAYLQGKKEHLMLITNISEIKTYSMLYNEMKEKVLKVA